MCNRRAGKDSNQQLAFSIQQSAVKQQSAISLCLQALARIRPYAAVAEC